MKRLIPVCLMILIAAITAHSEEPAAANVPAAAKMVGEIEVRTVPAYDAVVIVEKAADYAPAGGYGEGMDGVGPAYTAMFTDAFSKLGAWMGQGGKPSGPAFAVFMQDPAKTAPKDLTTKVGFPVEKGVTVNSPLVVEHFPEADMAVLRYQGPYSESARFWDTIKQWVPEKGYEFAGAPMEVYFKGPGDANLPPSEYVTEIRMPVRKAAKQPEAK